MLICMKKKLELKEVWTNIGVEEILIWIYMGFLSQWLIISSLCVISGQIKRGLRVGPTVYKMKCGLYEILTRKNDSQVE